jgi:hypothetical protein
MVFCYILWTFRIVCGNLVLFSPFWYFVPRKIWQPRFEGLFEVCHCLSTNIWLQIILRRIGDQTSRQLDEKSTATRLFAIYSSASAGCSVVELSFRNLKRTIWERKITGIFVKRLPGVPGVGERTQVLSISFIFSFSPLYRWATLCTAKVCNRKT